MKAILMSIRPEWVAKILNGEKTIEIRKKFPKDYVGWVYIYCTKGKTTFEKTLARYHDGKVVARFWCDRVEEISFYQHKTFFEDGYEKEPTIVWQDYATSTFACGLLEEPSCLSFEELHDYLQDKGGYAIHITKLEIFDKPKELKEFTPRYEDRAGVYYGYPLTRAPQSFCFIEV